MRSETAEAVNQVSTTFRGVRTPLSNALFYGWHQVRGVAIIRSTFFGRGERVIGGGTREPSFFLVASHQRRFVVMATSRKYFFHHLGPVPFGEGTMRRTGRD